MGVSLLPRIRYAVLPQLGPAFSSAVLYRFDVNIREASVLGLVGAGGIGAPLPGNEVRGGQLVVCTAPGIFSNIFSFCDESPDYGTLFLL